MSPPLPRQVVDMMLDNYEEIKQQFFLRKFRPSELDGGRFAECVVRIIEYQDTGQFTPIGAQLDSDRIINRAGNNIQLHESLRFLIPRQARILLDVRNRRDVAHIGGDVSPNTSDAKFVVHVADWMLTEIVRLFFQCNINDARKIVESINGTKIPMVADIDGFLRIQNVNLDARQKALVIMYHKDPAPVLDTDIARWTRYQNTSRLKTTVLVGLDAEALIHYESGICTILPKGKLYVENNIPLELLS
jgi:hypothetical protein